MFGLGGLPSFSSIRSGMMGSNPMADPGGTTSFASGGGMDVMGSLKKNSDFGSQYANNSMASPFQSVGASPFGRGGGFMGFGG